MLLHNIPHSIYLTKINQIISLEREQGEKDLLNSAAALEKLNNLSEM